jgi:hypothetical protein
MPSFCVGSRHRGSPSRLSRPTHPPIRRRDVPSRIPRPRGRERRPCEKSSASGPNSRRRVAAPPEVLPKARSGRRAWQRPSPPPRNAGAKRVVNRSPSLPLCRSPRRSELGQAGVGFLYPRNDATEALSLLLLGALVVEECIRGAHRIDGVDLFVRRDGRPFGVRRSSVPECSPGLSRPIYSPLRNRREVIERRK